MKRDKGIMHRFMHRLHKLFASDAACCTMELNPESVESASMIPKGPTTGAADRNGERMHHLDQELNPQFHTSDLLRSRKASRLLRFA